MLFAETFNLMKKRKKRKLKKKWAVWLGLVLLGFILYSNIRIDRYSKGKLYDTVSDVPHYQTALVLGTSPTGRNGGPFSSPGRKGSRRPVSMPQMSALPTASSHTSGNGAPDAKYSST
jgi:hypothetical protein